MTKLELVERLALECRITKKDARRYAEATLVLLSNALVRDTRSHIPPLGAFVRTKRKSRRIANPQDLQGPKMTIPESASVRFRVSKSIKAKLNAATVDRPRSSD